jgi:hypothetical protein
VINAISGNVAISSGSLSVDTIFATSGNVGVGTSLVLRAANAVTSGAGGNILLQAGTQVTTGGDGKIIIRQPGGTPGTNEIYLYTVGTQHTLEGAGASSVYINLKARDKTYVFGDGTSAGSQWGSDFTTNSDMRFGNTTRIRWSNSSSTSSLGNAGIDYASQGTLYISNGLTSGGSLAFKGSTTTLNSDVNNLSLDGSAFQRLNVTSGCSVTGLSFVSGGAHVNGRFIRLANVGTQNLTLSNQDALSSGNNRFYNYTSGNIVLGPNRFVDAVYDSTTGGWRVYGDNYPYVLPTTNGTSGQLLTTNGVNNLAWANGFALTSGSVTSGNVGNNAINSGNVSSGSIGVNHLISGLITTLTLGSGQVTSGSIASGQISQFKLSSGTVNSGHIGNNAVVSGSIASGSIGTNHCSSGTLFSVTNPATNRVVTSLASGTNSATANTNLTYDGSTLTANSVTSGSTVISVTGQAGQLFSVTDSNTGDIYQVGDISGVPIFTVNSNGYVKVVSNTFTGQTSSFTAFSIADTSGVAAFIEYYAINTTTSAYRAGTVSSVWNSTADTLVYSETSTDDLSGSTIGLTFSAAITSNNFVLTANIATGTWTIKLGTRVL